MTINSLRITNFRNLAEMELMPCTAGLNVICGDNGSGKTSLLEAIYYLGLGRSFRSSTSTRLIRHENDKFSIFSELTSELQRDIRVGVERSLSGQTKLRIAEKDASSIIELATYLPIRLINSQSHLIFESGPTFRRKYLDWGLFYQSEHFLSCWRQYERILKQRNILLKERRSKNELNAWTDAFVARALELDALRKDYIRALAPLIAEIAQELLSLTDLKCSYQSGWDEEKDFAAVLTDAYVEEMRAGHTLYGPHRADFNLVIKGIPVKHFLSRGQQKLLICAMMVAQGRLLVGQEKKGLIYLVDDLPAELDVFSRKKLISLLLRQQTQVFITAIESNTVCDLVDGDSRVAVKMFHVKHGALIL
jgi:DNA replication and repair protein RecF